MTEREIFEKAIDLPDRDAQAAFLDQACGDDREIRGRVEALIRSHEDAGSFLNGSAKANSPTVALTPSIAMGTRVGPYKLLQRLGEGGMGEVYMAEQTEPVERRVAVKVIKAGMDSRRVIARFEAERQALAIMDHPNIAKVFDAGTTDSGRPYFVMELVKGVPITQYCDEHRLDPRQRLGLFQDVCHAVQHAHQKGIIHRDLKPSNVLVAEYDDQPVVKVIDFGVAKAIQQRLTEKTMFTEVGAVVGTIEYMSPEQAKLNQLDIDTRSDIYSLGVLLYELLTGETPFDRKRLRSAAFDEMLRIIREEEPSRPSIKLSTSASLPSVAANRHVEPKRLSTLVRGELDWIVMKALEKDRSRRYDTANGFACDIQRYLSDEPVQACPPSAGYRFKKFARRNRGPMTIAAVATVTLIVIALGSVITATNFRNLAAREGAAKQDAELARNDAERARDSAQDAQHSAQDAQRREETERERATGNLYDSLIREVQSIRQARKTGYGDVAWQRLADARQLDTPKVDLAQLRAEAVSCLGDFAGKLPSEIKFNENVTATAVGPAAAQLAVGLAGGDTIVYDVGNDRVLQRLPGHQEPIVTVTFSSDQHTLVTGGSLGTVDIWQLENGAYRHIKSVKAGQGLKRPRWRLSCVLDADSKRLAIAYYGQKEIQLHEIQLHGLQSDNDHKVFRMALGESVRSATLSPDGQSLVALTSGSVLVVWNVEREEVVARQSLQLGGARSVVFCRNGKSIACSFEFCIKILDANSLTETFSIRGTPIFLLAISPDGMLLAYHEFQKSGVISLCNRLAGRHDVEPAHSNPTSLQFGPDANALVSSGGKSVRLWRPGVTPEMRLISGHQLGVAAVAFSPDNKQLASCSKDRSVKIWDADTGALIQSLGGFAASIQHVAYSPDGKWLATCDWSGSIGIWDTASWACLGRLDCTRYGVGRNPKIIAFSPNGEYLAVSGLGVVLWKITEIRRWIKKAEQRDPIPVHLVLPNGQTNWVAFSPDSSMLASTTYTADGVRLRIWQTSTGQELWSPPVRLGLGYKNGFFYPDSRHVMFLATDGTAHTWDLVDRKLKNVTPVSSRVALSPDGRLCVDKSGIKRVDTNEMLVPSLPKGSGPGQIWCAAWSSDRQKLAICFSDGAITLWDLKQVHSRLSEIGLAWDAVPPVTEPYLKIQPRELTVGQQTTIAEAFRQRGVASLTKNDLVRAEQDFVECQKLVPDSPHAKWDDFLLSLSQRNWEKIIADSDQLDRKLIDDQLGRGLANCAANLSWKWATDAQAEQPQLDAAAFLAEMAVNFAPEDPNYWRSRALWHSEQGNYEQSVAAWTHAIRLQPTLVWPYNRRCRAYRKLGQLDLALADAEQAVALDSNDRFGWLELGFTCARLKKWTRAEEAYERFHRFQPDNLRSWRGYTNALVASGQLTKYREFCAEQLKRHGQTDDRATAKWLTQGLLLVGPDAVDDWSLPLRLSQLVLNSKSVVPGEKSHASALLCRAGEYERSLKMGAEATAESGRREPGPLGYCWRAMAHHGLGNIDQARELASKARELADSSVLGAEVHEIFEILFTELMGKLDESPLPLAGEVGLSGPGEGNSSTDDTTRQEASTKQQDPPHDN